MIVTRLCAVLCAFFLVSCNQIDKEASNQEEKIKHVTMKAEHQIGVISKTSTKNFEDTYASLVEVLTKNPNLKIIAELNHQANAASVGLTLNPTRIVMFGNPRLGTPLMQTSASVGLDLPQKMLVTQSDSGAVVISYNDPLYLKERHGIEGNEEVFKKVSGALDMISNAAAGL